MPTLRLATQADFDSLQARLRPKQKITIDLDQPIAPPISSAKKPERSLLEVALDSQILASSLPAPEIEYPFMRGRLWRFDFAWPREMLAVEVEGAVHRIKSRFKGDIPKYAEALLLGWRVLRVGSDQVKDGTALTWIKKALDVDYRVEDL